MTLLIKCRWMKMMGGRQTLLLTRTLMIISAKTRRRLKHHKAIPKSTLIQSKVWWRKKKRKKTSSSKWKALTLNEVIVRQKNQMKSYLSTTTRVKGSISSLATKNSPMMILSRMWMQVALNSAARLEALSPLNETEVFKTYARIVLDA